VQVDCTGVYGTRVLAFEWDGKHFKRFTIDCPRLWVNSSNEPCGNHYHGIKSEWFAGRVEEVSEWIGYDVRQALINSCPIERARAYLDMAGFFGVENFDSYPALLTRTECRKYHKALFARK